VNTHRPRKRFGQHFLHDPAVVTRIVRAISPQPGDRMVEIGPGLGALTGTLLESGADLDVIELDRDLAAKLRAEHEGEHRIRVHQADALEFDFLQLGSADRRLRVVGNLPYNVSTPLLFHLLDQAPIIDDMHFMLQREVVERLVAAPGRKDYGRLTVMVRLLCESEKLFDVGPGAFRPAPRVTSAVVRLRVRRKPCVALEDAATFRRLIAQLFSRRRKTLRNSLRDRLSEAELEGLGIDPMARPETLDLDGFAALANAIHGKREDT
jgi:16S rRNA (adenine1518-N6/adenine1519-N6)-dimethyltransferase